jgi:hypothetical protein
MTISSLLCRPTGESKDIKAILFCFRKVCLEKITIGATRNFPQLHFFPRCRLSSDNIVTGLTWLLRWYPLPLGATAQGELWSPEQSASILLYSSSFLPIASSLLSIFIQSTHPRLIILFLNNLVFTVWGCYPHAQPPTRRTRVSLFVWLLPLDLSGMCDPTSSYATAGIALTVSGALTPHHHDKVETPSVGSSLILWSKNPYRFEILSQYTEGVKINSIHGGITVQCHNNCVRGKFTIGWKYSKESRRA